MGEPDDSAGAQNTVRGSSPDIAAIPSLIADLAGKDGMVREKARRSLVGIGGPAVAPLVEALNDPNEQLRWEAAKALGQIADPAAAPALVEALTDKVFDVRWLAADGLIAVGRAALVPLLEALMEHSNLPRMRLSAHHVLHDLAHKDPELKELLRPVLVALDDIEPSLEVPWAARSVLEALTGVGGKHSR